MPARSRRRPLRRALPLAALIALAAALLAPGAAFASHPLAITGPARSVGYSGALLTGTVYPDASDTSFYFQYGPTRAYGGQSLIADAGGAPHAVKVAEAVTGLQPLTLYHFRLVAVDAAGHVAQGADETFVTTKVPLSLQILTSPNPVTFGGTATVQGTLSGTGNGNREVVLQSQQFPFTAGFQNTGNPELTTSTGGFSFTVPGLTQATQFRVTTVGNAAVVSPVASEAVAVSVVTHIGRARRRGFARFFGTVTPAETGMQVAVLRTVHGRGVLVGGTTLRAGSTGASTFSKVVPIKAGVYRVLVRVTSGGQTSAYGQPLRIG